MLVFSCIAAVGVTLVNPSLASAVFTAGLLALTAASLLQSLFALRKLSVEAAPREHGRVGARVVLPVRVRNSSIFSRQAVVIREACPFAAVPLLQTPIKPLAPLEEREVRRGVIPSRRGLFVLDKIVVRTADPAGLFRRQRTFSHPRELLVFPRIVQLDRIPLAERQRVVADVGRPQGISGGKDEFYGVREYRPTDGMRMIHWRASARHRRLMVKQYEDYRIVQVTIMLDSHLEAVSDDSPDSNFELLVTAVASLIHHLSGLLCQLSFHAGPRTGHVHGTAGSQQMTEACMLQLATLTAGDVSLSELADTVLDRVQPDSVLYCLSMSRSPDIERVFELMLQRDVDVRWLYAPPELFGGDDDDEAKSARLDQVLADCQQVLPRPTVLHPGRDLKAVLERI
jgi:uncharacterized protein (DUF58 family)